MSNPNLREHGLSTTSLLYHIPPLPPPSSTTSLLYHLPPLSPPSSTTICVGDILIFDGDVIHRGCAYKSTCVAMHIYLDVPQVKRPPPNKPGSFMKLPAKKARA